MEHLRRTPVWLGIVLVLYCVCLLALSLWPTPGGTTLPAAVCLTLGAVPALAHYYTVPGEHVVRPWLWVPALASTAFGVVFLLNALTGDWGAWAYAWTLCVAAAAAGVMLAAREARLPTVVSHTATWVAAAGLVAFGIFGALVGGPLMQTFTASLLAAGAVTGGLWVWRRLRWQRSPADVVLDADRLGTPVDPAANETLIEPLSPRELEVLGLIEDGLSNAEIADRLVVAQSTVKTHINSIYGKLGAKSRTDALRRARDLGLL